jgi:hypothetical protein
MDRFEAAEAVEAAEAAAAAARAAVKAAIKVAQEAKEDAAEARLAEIRAWEQVNIISAKRSTAETEAALKRATSAAHAAGRTAKMMAERANRTLEAATEADAVADQADAVAEAAAISEEFALRNNIKSNNKPKRSWKNWFRGLSRKKPNRNTHPRQENVELNINESSYRGGKRKHRRTLKNKRK